MRYPAADLPNGRGRWVVLELNGAVEFTLDYAPSRDVFEETAFILARAAHERLGHGDAVPSASAA